MGDTFAKRPCLAVPRVGSVGQRIRAGGPSNVFRDRMKQDAGACPGHLVQDFSVWDGRVESNGTGLGLAVSRYLVARHGGTLHIESTPGEGTSVLVDLPLDGPGASEESKSA